MAQVRALRMLIPTVGKLFGMLIDDGRLPWYVLCPPLPSQLPVRLQPLQFALGHVPALSPIRVLVAVACACACSMAHVCVHASAAQERGTRLKSRKIKSGLFPAFHFSHP